MSIFDSINKSSEGATNLSKKYVSSTVSYYKLKAFFTVTSTTSLLTKITIIGGLFVIGLVFVAISGAIVLGNHLQNIPLGYLIIGLLFMIIGFIVFLFRKFIDKAIVKRISPKFYKNQ